MRLRSIPLVLACILLTACSTFAPPPTATPTLTLTPTQTATSTPTETPIPTATFTPLPPTSTPDVVGALIPTGEPVENWKGIPIMPGAISGSGDTDSYTFTIRATAVEVEAYYDREMVKLGAYRFIWGEGSKNGTMLVIYMWNDTAVTISTIPQDDFLLVMIIIK